MTAVLTEDDAAPGEVLVHLDINCTVVRDHRQHNRPLVTLIGVEPELMPSWVNLHNCKGDA